MVIKRIKIVKHVLMIYQLTKLFNLSSLNETAFSYIERCYTIVAETDNFYQLNFNLVLKIIVNSGLHLTSEIQILNAADERLFKNVPEGEIDELVYQPFNEPSDQVSTNRGVE